MYYLWLFKERKLKGEIYKYMWLRGLIRWLTESKVGESIAAVCVRYTAGGFSVCSVQEADTTESERRGRALAIAEGLKQGTALLHVLLTAVFLPQGQKWVVVIRFHSLQILNYCFIWNLQKNIY